MGQRAGTIEVFEGKNIKYYMVIEKANEFYLTTKGQPQVKNKDKYTNLYYKKNK